MSYAGVSGYVISTAVTILLAVSMVSVPPNVQLVEQPPARSPVLPSLPDTLKTVSAFAAADAPNNKAQMIATADFRADFIAPSPHTSGERIVPG